MGASLFAGVELAPRDPILGLNEAFNAEKNPAKVNLGVGVYFGDDRKIPLLAAVKSAEKARLETQPPRGYQPIEGTPAYNGAVQNLLFGKDSELLAAGRAIPAGAGCDRRSQHADRAARRQGRPRAGHQAAEAGLRQPAFYPGRLHGLQGHLRVLTRQMARRSLPGVPATPHNRARNPEPLSEADLKAIEKIRCDLGEKFCHRCEYCMPCAQGVQISSVLMLRPAAKRLSHENVKGWLGTAMETVEKCIECGECEQKCPYNLPISDLLKENLALYKHYVGA